MIPVPYYITVYYITISFITLILCTKLFESNKVKIESISKNKIWSVVLLLVTILFIGLRDPWGAFEYFGDTITYSSAFVYYSTYIFVDDLFRDIGFSALMKFCSSFMTISMFYLFCAFLYVYPVYITFIKWFDNFAIYALLIYVLAMSFLSFGINGVRNGLAVSFFIFAMGNINKKWLMILFMFLAASMHKSILLPIILFFVCRFIKNIKWTIFIWFISIPACLLTGNTILNFTQTFLSGIISDTRMSNEIMLNNIGFRLDFLIYSAVAIGFGWFYVIKKKFNDKFYIQLLNTYILTNAVWIAVFMYDPYTNRYAFLSWCIMPIVMVYPLLKENFMKNKYRFIGYLAFGSLLFSWIIFLK